jgi:hypothetical protein
MNKDELDRKKRELERQLKELERIESQKREDSMQTVQIDPNRTVRQPIERNKSKAPDNAPLSRGKKALYIFLALMVIAMVARGLAGIILLKMGYDIDAKDFDGNLSQLLTINFLVTAIILASVSKPITKWSQILGITFIVYVFQLGGHLFLSPPSKFISPSYQEIDADDSFGYERTPPVEKPNYTPPTNPVQRPEKPPTPPSSKPVNKPPKPAKTQPRKQESRPPAPARTRTPEPNAPNSFLYKTSFISYALDPILRQEPTPYGKELYKCPKNASVYVINTEHKAYYYVSVNKKLGYVSKALLQDAKDFNNSIGTSGLPVSSSKVPQVYVYKTSFNSKTGSPVLLEQPKSGSRVIINLNKNDDVYVIQRTNAQYYLVVVDGNRGYVSKYTLNQK